MAHRTRASVIPKAVDRPTAWIQREATVNAFERDLHRMKCTTGENGTAITPIGLAVRLQAAAHQEELDGYDACGDELRTHTKNDDRGLSSARELHADPNSRAIVATMNMENAMGSEASPYSISATQDTWWAISKSPLGGSDRRSRHGRCVNMCNCCLHWTTKKAARQLA